MYKSFIFRYIFMQNNSPKIRKQIDKFLSRKEFRTNSSKLKKQHEAFGTVRNFMGHLDHKYR